MNSPAEASSPAATTLDAFYGGKFHLLQPAGSGFRGGLDALLLAASIPPNRQGVAADLGAGAGTAGFAVATRCPDLRVTLVENQPAMVALAERSIRLAENAALGARLRVIEADILGNRDVRERAGMFDQSFATVITNPPFHPKGGRDSPDALRHAARAIPTADFLAGWIRTASILLEDGGLFALLARPDNLPDILAAVPNRFGDLRILPVFSRADRPAIRILVHARRGSNAPLSLLAPIVLHGSDGALTEVGAGISTGEATIALGLT